MVKRNPMAEGKIFEEYAWPAVRRNFPRGEGWKRFQEPTLPSGLRPDNVLWNEDTDEFVVIEIKDVAQLTESHVRQTQGYMAELGAAEGFMPIAWDTEVPRRVRRRAKQAHITIRRLEWRR